MTVKERDRMTAQGMADGSAVAYEAFCERFSNLVYKECMNYCTESCDTDELRNDILIHLLITIGRYDPGKGTLAAWVLTVTKNFLYDYYRKKLREPEMIPCDEHYLDLFPARQNSEAGEKREIRSPDIEMLNKSLREISERDRSILQYRAEGFSYDDIGGFLRINAGAAKTAHGRAVKKVRRYFISRNRRRKDKIT